MRYAAYGSNLHPVRLVKRTPSAQFVGTAFVAGWSLQCQKRSRDGSGKCNIISGDRGIHVAVYELSESDEIVLDGIEGLGFGYEEISLSVPGFGECKSYAAEESFIDEALAPYDWYKALVLVGAHVHSFPAPYIDAIEAIVACQDPDAGRSAAKWAIVEEARAFRHRLSQ